MIDRLKQLWETATWWQKVLLILLFPLVLAVLWGALLRRSSNPDTSLETAETSAKAEATRQEKEEKVVNEYRSATRGLEREHMKRRQEIETIRTEQQMRRALDEELRR